MVFNLLLSKPLKPSPSPYPAFRDSSFIGLFDSSRSFKILRDRPLERRDFVSKYVRNIAKNNNTVVICKWYGKISDELILLNKNGDDLYMKIEKRVKNVNRKIVSIVREKGRHFFWDKKRRKLQVNIRSIRNDKGKKNENKIVKNSGYTFFLFLHFDESSANLPIF